MFLQKETFISFLENKKKTRHLILTKSWFIFFVFNFMSI